MPPALRNILIYFLILCVSEGSLLFLDRSPNIPEYLQRIDSS